MIDLTPAGLASVQAWAAHCFSLAFSVGILTGLVFSGGAALGRKAYTFAANFCIDLRFRGLDAEWEDSQEARALRAYNDACAVCSSEEYARAEVIRIALEVEDTRAWVPLQELYPGMANKAGDHS